MDRLRALLRETGTTLMAPCTPRTHDEYNSIENGADIWPWPASDAQWNFVLNEPGANLELIAVVYFSNFFHFKADFSNQSRFFLRGLLIL